MKKWNLIIDLERCNGCFNCFISCKDEHVGNSHPGYAAPQPLHGHRWIDIRTHERGQGILKWAGEKSILLSGLDGDLPFGMAARHAGEPARPGQP